MISRPRSILLYFLVQLLRIYRAVFCTVLWGTVLFCQTLHAQLLRSVVPGQTLPSLSPYKLPSQYLYDSWTSETGSPPLPKEIAPISITQTLDGYIWIGTSSG
ncbi:MAG: hypothetical protein NZ661_11995, partial [Candidatus Kapabacteria bacterium]|nr:hypothetical protein [Candidatus Kapabacteria bacterium]